MQSDEAWTDHLIYIATDGIKSGNTRDALRRLEEINAAIDKVQFTEDGVDCTELVLLEREKISQKLVRFAQQSGVDINIIRFLPIDEKSGFVRAMIILVKDYKDRHAKGKPKAG